MAWLFITNILMFLLLSVMVYVWTFHPNVKGKIKRPMLPGLAVAITSYFYVGWATLIVVSLYVASVWLIDKRVKV